jgi:hypothetical protein
MGEKGLLLVCLSAEAKQTYCPGLDGTLLSYDVWIFLMEVGEAHGYHLAVLDRFAGWLIHADCGVDDLSRRPAVAVVVREMVSEDVDGDLGLGRIEPDLVLEPIAEMAAWGLALVARGCRMGHGSASVPWCLFSRKTMSLRGAAILHQPSG